MGSEIGFNYLHKGTIFYFSCQVLERKNDNNLIFRI